MMTGTAGGSTELSLLLTEITSTSPASETESSELRLEVVEPDTGGRVEDDDGSRPPTAGAGDIEDLGDKFSVISLTSDISKSSESWADMLSDMFRERGGGGAGRGATGGIEAGDRLKFRLFNLHIRSISDVFFRLNFAYVLTRQNSMRSHGDPGSSPLNANVMLSKNCSERILAYVCRLSSCLNVWRIGCK
jgi:hypothetical protein